ncbi:MAG: ABC transporter ATP-binding protein [Oscillospiraceae bacterium]|jgi:spermidine/putrescine ABC transporter, ATP-binding protein PotA|nr:MAG: ABC transporter ATP-binding protein [Oscillospiraceae bacterium]
MDNTCRLPQQEETNKLIELQGITKIYDDNTVLDNIDLYIRKREFITLLGPSGCGKTTTLRIIAGFEYPTSGKVLFDGRDVSGVPPYKREVNTVFQKYALFPHMNVEDNIAFGLTLKKTPTDEIKRRVDEMLNMIDLPGYNKRKVDSLSGGQQQRIAIARALVNRPKVLLLDEPLGALDLKMRKEMQLELKSMQQQLGITFVYVTHDQEEALTMSDTIVVMAQGRIQQIGTPEMIYNEPKNGFVADFIGESNIIDGIMHADCDVSFGGARFECVDTGFSPDEPVDVVVRPEDIYLVEPEKGQISGRVISTTFKGVHYEMIVQCGDYEWMIQDTTMREVGAEVGLFVRPYDIHIMKKSDVKLYSDEIYEEEFPEETEEGYEEQ